MIDKQDGSLVPMKLSEFAKTGAIELPPEEVQRRILGQLKKLQKHKSKYLPKERQGPLLAKGEQIEIWDTTREALGKPTNLLATGIITGLGNKDLGIQMAPGSTVYATPSLVKGQLVLVKGHPFKIAGASDEYHRLVLRCLPARLLDEYKQLVRGVEAVAEPSQTEGAKQ